MGWAKSSRPPQNRRAFLRNSALSTCSFFLTQRLAFADSWREVRLPPEFFREWRVAHSNDFWANRLNAQNTIRFFNDWLYASQIKDAIFRAIISQSTVQSFQTQQLADQMARLRTDMVYTQARIDFGDIQLKYGMTPYLHYCFFNTNTNNIEMAWRGQSVGAGAVKDEYFFRFFPAEGSDPGEVVRTLDGTAQGLWFDTHVRGNGRDQGQVVLHRVSSTSSNIPGTNIAAARIIETKNSKTYISDTFLLSQGRKHRVKAIAKRDDSEDQAMVTELV